MHRRTALTAALVALVTASCASGQTTELGVTSTTSIAASTTAPVAATSMATAATVAATTTGATTATGTATTSNPATTSSTSSTPTITTIATTSTSSSEPSTTVDPRAEIVRTIGMSAGGREIVAKRYGPLGGMPVLVIGVIHGDEDAGLAITDRLERSDVPGGVTLWIVEQMNPDGVALRQRGNANGVDLNRNFPYQWGPIATKGEWEWAGTGPASEPETQAMVEFMTELQPRLVIWYHQDYDRIAPARGLDGRVRSRYAQLTGMQVLAITGGTYTGVAATWARRTLDDAVAFIVELGETLPASDAARHAEAVLTVAGELARGTI
jgi:protein MpaA